MKTGFDQSALAPSDMLVLEAATVMLNQKVMATIVHLHQHNPTIKMVNTKLMEAVLSYVVFHDMGSVGTCVHRLLDQNDDMKLIEDDQKVVMKKMYEVATDIVTMGDGPSDDDDDGASEADDIQYCIECACDVCTQVKAYLAVPVVLDTITEDDMPFVRAAKNAILKMRTCM